MQDVDLLAKVTLPRCSGSGHYCDAFLLGRVSAGRNPTYYRVGVVQGSGSRDIVLRAQRSDGSNLVNALDTGIPAAGGAQVMLRVEFVGVNPTVIRARAWAVGTNEPSSWLLNVTNASSAEQVAGAIGVRVRNEDTAQAHSFAFHRYRATTFPRPPPSSTIAMRQFPADGCERLGKRGHRRVVDGRRLALELVHEWRRGQRDRERRERQRGRICRASPSRMSTSSRGSSFRSATRTTATPSFSVAIRPRIARRTIELEWCRAPAATSSSARSEATAAILRVISTPGSLLPTGRRSCCASSSRAPTRPSSAPAPGSQVPPNPRAGCSISPTARARSKRPACSECASRTRTRGARIPSRSRACKRLGARAR